MDILARHRLSRALSFYILLQDRQSHPKLLQTIYRSNPCVWRNLSMSDTQVFVALAIALIPGLLALRLSTELYK